MAAELDEGDGRNARIEVDSGGMGGVSAALFGEPERSAAVLEKQALQQAARKKRLYKVQCRPCFCRGRLST